MTKSSAAQDNARATDQAPKSWAEKAYPKLVFYNKHDKGTHFAAWEQPADFTADLRAAFKTLR